MAQVGAAGSVGAITLDQASPYYQSRYDYGDDVLDQERLDRVSLEDAVGLVGEVGVLRDLDRVRHLALVDRK